MSLKEVVSIQVLKMEPVSFSETVVPYHTSQSAYFSKLSPHKVSDPYILALMFPPQKFVCQPSYVTDGRTLESIRAEWQLLVYPLLNSVPHHEDASYA
jgi:hypothetical protein